MQRLIWSWIYRIVGKVEMRKLCNPHNDQLLPCGFQMAVLVLHVCQSCETLCDPMDCSPPGSSVHGISQARILEWVAISSYRWFSWPRDWIWVLHWQVDSLLLGHLGSQMSGDQSQGSILSFWAGSCGAFLEQPFPQTLCFSSFLKYLGSSIWCRFPELFCRCEHLLHPKRKILTT